MTRSHTEICTAIARQLAESIGEDRFEMWFGDKSVFEFGDNLVVVRASDDLSLSFIRQQFDSSIRAAVGSVTGSTTKIQFALAGKSKAVPNQGCLFSDNELVDAGVESRQPVAKRYGPRRMPGTKSGTQTAALPFDSKESRQHSRSLTLESFQFGDDNLLLKTAISQVLAFPGKFNPLVLYGQVGSGKTHLAQGIVAAARTSCNYRRSMCLSAEQFTTGFIEGLHGRGLPVFRNKYRQLDLLVLDDIQFLAGKKATIVEFQNTIEAMLRSGKQIVITVDRPVYELDFLGESLTTRLASGMTCPISWPDIESRIVIAENHARHLGIQLSPDTIRHVCQRMGRDVRMLFGAINRIHAATSAMGNTIDPAAASQLLSDLFHSQTPVISMDRIEQVVCDICGVSSEEIKGQKRIKRVSTARMLAIWLTRRHTTAGLAEIGEYFGGRNHSTIVAARKKIDTLKSADAEIDIKSQRVKLSAALERLETRLRVG